MEDLKIHDNDYYVSGFSELPDNAPEPIQTDNAEIVPYAQTASTSEDVQSNFDFYNNIQNVQPYSAHGGSNHTASSKKTFIKKRKKNKMQKNSRRINRKH